MEPAERVDCCDRCGRAMPAHGHYIVRIEVLADPAMGPINSQELEKMDFEAEWSRLLGDMRNMTAEQLQDQVYRHLDFKICWNCQREFLADPLGADRAGGVDKAQA